MSGKNRPSPASHSVFLCLHCSIPPFFSRFPTLPRFQTHIELTNSQTQKQLECVCIMKNTLTIATTTRKMHRVSKLQSFWLVFLSNRCIPFCSRLSLGLDQSWQSLAFNWYQVPETVSIQPHKIVCSYTQLLIATVHVFIISNVPRYLGLDVVCWTIP